MDDQAPLLEIEGPRGEAFAYALSADRVTIGRLPGANNVALEPDEQRVVSREVHCVIEREGGAWWIRDNESRNGTYLAGDSTFERVLGRAKLSSGDVICVLGALSEDGTKTYWRLTFRDPLQTVDAISAPLASCLVVDLVTGEFARRDAGRLVPLDLPRQQRRLLGYMARRNQEHSGLCVICFHEDLIKAVWSDELRLTSDLNHLVSETRKLIEPNPERPELLQNVRGIGYRLRTCVSR